MFCTYLPGSREAKYSYEYEADLHRHYNSCDKNPHHTNFIPIYNFGIENLPRGYQDLNLVNYILGISYLTVRVKVNYVSEFRPATDNVNSKPYPGYTHRGLKDILVGTGYVNRVEISKHIKEVYCKCKACRNSNTPITDFATLTIQTAAHIVFDEQEGQYTTCDLFFDREGIPLKCPGVVTLEGMFDVKSDVNEDVCSMKHYTHNMKLATKLRTEVEKTEKIRKTLIDKMNERYGLSQTQVDEDMQPLLFIVSHPHGCSKHVSLGRWTGVETFTSETAYLMYNAATCPGSSGAPTYVIPAGFQLSGVQLRALRVVHCGISTLLPEFNYGCIEGG